VTPYFILISFVLVFLTSFVFQYQEAGADLEELVEDEVYEDEEE